MKDEGKAKEDLITELEGLRRRDAGIEASEADFKQIEEALGESEEQYKAVVESVGDGITINVGTRRAFVNRRFLAIHGLQKVSQAVGLPIDHYIIPEDRPLVNERTLARQRVESVPGVYEYRIVRPDGQVKWTPSSGQR